MSDIQAHADAILDLLRADVGPPALVVYDGAVPSPTPAPPYVLVYVVSTRPPGDPGNSLKATSDVVTVRAICHCVGGNQIAARGVASRVEAALLDRRPAITGRSAGLIRQDESRDSDRDESTGTLVMDMVQVYRLTTQPA